MWEAVRFDWIFNLETDTGWVNFSVISAPIWEENLSVDASVVKVYFRRQE